jgi:hypothetical protein
MAKHEAKQRIWCCIPRGMSSIQVKLNQSQFFIGEAFVIIIDIDNTKSRLAVRSTNVRLSNVITVSDANGHTKAQAFSYDLGTNKDAITPGSALTGENALVMEV